MEGITLSSAPRAWNRLPTDLKMLRSTDSFRRKLKLSLSLCSDPRERADLFCDASSVYQYGGRNINTITVTVTVSSSYRGTVTEKAFYLRCLAVTLRELHYIF